LNSDTILFAHFEELPFIINLSTYPSQIGTVNLPPNYSIQCGQSAIISVYNDNPCYEFVGWRDENDIF